MPQARPEGVTQISVRHDTQTDTNAGVLLEKQLVLFCPNIGLLSTCVLSLIPLLRPFTWQSLLLPVLPDNLLSFLEAPVPFVIGVQVSSCFRMCFKTLCRLLCVLPHLRAIVPFVVEVLVYNCRVCVCSWVHLCSRNQHVCSLDSGMSMHSAAHCYSNPVLLMKL